jgi:ABC-type transport system involved in multi-copper enzyme maturation permease subunit
MKSVLGFQMWALAINVWREAVRDRLLHILTGSGVVLMLFSLILGQMAVGGQDRVVQNMGFWILGIWGLLAVVYLGSNIIRQEIQQHTVYLVLSRPVNRPTFLLGKFIGVLLVLLSIFCLLAAAWLAIMQLKAIPLTTMHFWALAFIFGEWILLAAFSLFFASFTSPLLHNFFLVGVTFLGHWSNDLRIFAVNAQALWLKKLLNILYYILPNIEALNFREAALYNEAISSGLLMEGAVVLIGWIATALAGANLLFARRRLL